MKALTPKDASILATIAENQGMSETSMKSFLMIADDLQEVEPVARLLLSLPPADGQTFSLDSQSSAIALQRWAKGNRIPRHGDN